MTDASSNTVLLPEVLDLGAAAPLAAQLMAVRGSDLVLDGSAVRRIGGQCLQVLLSARITWAAEGHSLVLTNASPDLTEGLAVLGLTDFPSANAPQD